MNRDTPFRLTEVAMCMVATMASGLVYGRFFASSEYLAPVCAAAVIGALAATVAGLRHWRLFRTTAVAVVGFAILATYGVFRDTVHHGMPTWDTASELAGGVLEGWVRVLLVAPPADVHADLLITPVFITWFASFSAVTLALRTRSVLAPIAPALAAFALALLCAGRQPGVHITATVLFLAAGLSLMLVRTIRVGGRLERDRRAMTSRLAFGVPAVVVIALPAVLYGQVSPLASAQQRFDPRALVPPPVPVIETLTPLARLKGQLREDPPRRLFTVRMDGPERTDRIRVAALDRFDGVSWTSTDRFLVAGSQLAPDPALTRSRTVSARFTIEDLDGPFLPTIGWPSRLDIVRTEEDPIGFGTTSGALVTTRQTLRGVGYDFVGEVSVRDDGLTRAVPSTTPEYRGHTELPVNVPPLLRALAQQLTATEPTPYGKLVAIEQHLRGLPYRLDAMSGHSYAAMIRVLTRTGAGYAEQNASAFAVLARAAGFPARVAVGYRVGDSPAGSHVVTTRDADAWAEVHFDGYGWVAFDPTDTSRDEPGPPQGPANAAQPAEPPPGQPQPDEQLPPPSPGRPGNDAGEVLRAAAWAAWVPVTLAVLLVTAIPGVKARKRWRRRHASGNAERVVGAWLEATDRLIERGIPAPPSHTASEIAENAAGTLGAAADSLVSLATLATKAVYARGEPRDDDVQRAWQLESHLRRQLYPGRFSVRWVGARLDPRPVIAGWREARRLGESRR